MKNWLLIMIVLFLCGCAGNAQHVELRHEQDEQRLMTEREFKSRVSQSATLIYEGMRAISEAAERYAAAHDDKLPTGIPDAIKSQLLADGYLNVWPQVPPFAFTEAVQKGLVYQSAYDDMDGLGAPDDAIYAPDLKVEVCLEFSRRYSSFSPEGTIHDWDAAGRKYPGEVFGKHMKLFAINWLPQNGPEYCEIVWVMQYNE